MPPNFAQKTITVTGAASGIGRATCHHLASLGANLAMADVNSRDLNALRDALQREHPAQAFLADAVDVSDGAAVRRWVERAASELGPLDGAANLAGIMGADAYRVALQDVSDGDWERVMGVNLGGVLNCMRAQIPALRDNGGGGGGGGGGSAGAIVNASSLAGLVGIPRHAAYVASKHAVIGLSKSVAKELGGRGVRVNVIAPGAIETPLMTDAMQRMGPEANSAGCALGRAGKPEEVARLIAFLLSDESSYMTGTVQIVDGGFLC